MSKISIKQLAIYTADQIAAGASSSDVAQKLAGYLLAERRTRDSPLLFRAIEKELDVRGSTQVTVTSAHGVSDEIKAQLAKILGAKNPTFDSVVDPSVIGGVKARAGESEIDLTVRARLNRFKQQVING